MSRFDRSVCEAAQPQLAPGENYTIINPLRGRTWTDEAGTTWRRRGDQAPDAKRAGRLLKRDDVLVVHVHDGLPHRHTGSDRTGLLADVASVLSRDDPEPMHTFELGEFRSDDHRVLVMIVEHC